MQKKSSPGAGEPDGIAPSASSSTSSCGSIITVSVGPEVAEYTTRPETSFVRPYHVGIAGATGLVGQRLVARVASHPWFTLTALGASDRSSGRAYGDVVRWMLPEGIPGAALRLVVGGCTPSDFGACDLVLS